MDQLRFPKQMLREMRYSPGKKNKSRGIIRIIHAIFMVQCRPMKELRLINEIKSETLARLPTPNLALDTGWTKRQIQFHAVRRDFGESLGNVLVERRYQPDLVTSTRKSFAERPDHVGQSTSLGVRVDFATGE